MTNKLGLCVSAIARKFGYVSQKKAALGFTEGWYMHNERAAACWQSVEEAFANSELQDSLSENIEFRKGELTQFYFNSQPPIEKLSFSKCIEQKEGFVLVPIMFDEAMMKAAILSVTDAGYSATVEQMQVLMGACQGAIKAYAEKAQESE
ncbi:MAG: hypothetical protein EOO68_27205 [Moraxellaceae bacterium]|nr:MAG: hypothetical protein EOO68_27205 [Moraxellaceae bacterium]